ncbi:MAG: DUF309 domain-containing protein [Actinobacteria bacterium]|nr:DUF309 domain-containing protein [Actinomycetota bacterium]
MADRGEPEPIRRVAERDRNAEGRPENARPRDRYGRPLPRGTRDELPDRQDPADVVAAADEALARAVALFDAERFFEAHEFFEYAWKSDDVDEADRDFWKGLAQVAVGCCHAQRGNDEGAVALLERAAGYLRPYPSPHHGVATDRMIHRALAVAAAVRGRGASPRLPFPRFPLATGA